MGGRPTPPKTFFGKSELGVLGVPGVPRGTYVVISKFRFDLEGSPVGTALFRRCSRCSGAIIHSTESKGAYLSKKHEVCCCILLKHNKVPNASYVASMAAGMLLCVLVRVLILIPIAQ